MGVAPSKTFWSSLAWGPSKSLWSGQDQGLQTYSEKHKPQLTTEVRGCPRTVSFLCYHQSRHRRCFTKSIRLNGLILVEVLRYEWSIDWLRVVNAIRSKRMSLQLYALIRKMGLINAYRKGSFQIRPRLQRRRFPLHRTLASTALSICYKLTITMKQGGGEDSQNLWKSKSQCVVVKFIAHKLVANLLVGP